MDMIGSEKYAVKDIDYRGLQFLDEKTIEEMSCGLGAHRLGSIRSTSPGFFKLGDFAQVPCKFEMLNFM